MSKITKGQVSPPPAAIVALKEGKLVGWFVPPFVVPAFMVLLIVARAAYLAYS
jgi:hypothetical protein